METVDDRWKRHNNNLDAIQINGIDFLHNDYFRKFVVMPLSENTKMTLNEIEVLINHHEPKDMSVLEVGAGFGNFCKLLYETTKPKSYTILDTRSMIRFSRAYLAHHNVPCSFVESENIENLHGYKFDLFISNICLSETPDDYRQMIIDNIWPNCKRLFVIDGCRTTKEGRYNEWLGWQVKNHFPVSVIQDMPYSICKQKHQSLYIGIR